MKRLTSAEILDRITGDNEELREMIAEESSKLYVAEMIFSARTKAGLTQDQLARKVRSKQSVIARLESADYDGHSLNMLSRIAYALGCNLKVYFEPIEKVDNNARIVTWGVQGNMDPANGNTDFKTNQPYEYAA